MINFYYTPTASVSTMQNADFVLELMSPFMFYKPGKCMDQPENLILARNKINYEITMVKELLQKLEKTKEQLQNDINKLPDETVLKYELKEGN